MDAVRWAMFVTSLWARDQVRWVRRLPGWQKLILAGALAAVTAILLYVFIVKQGQEKADKQIAKHWQDFDGFALSADADGMRRCLDRIEQQRPGDVMARKRREQLERGEADADDQAMILYWMNRHWADNRIDGSAHEARKLLLTIADDWQAHCILADQALRQAEGRDPKYLAAWAGHGALALTAWRHERKADAVHRLQTMPSPLAVRRLPPVYSLMHGMRLRRQAGVDDQLLRSIRHDKILTSLKNPEIIQRPTGDLLFLLQTYVESFEDLDAYPDLPSFWSGSEKVAQFLLDDPNLNLLDLVRLGHWQFRQHECLALLVSRKNLTSERANPLDDDLNARLEEICKKVRERDPALAQGYLFSADLELQRRDVEGALRCLAAGESACAEKLAFVNSQFALLRKFAPPAVALERMEKIAGRYPESEPMLHALAQCAWEARRGDKVLDLCAKARRLAPGSFWPDKEEARVHLNQEKHEEVFALLDKHKQHDAESLGMYIHALILAKKKDDIASMLVQVVNLAKTPDEICPALRAALKGQCSDESALAARLAVKRFPDYHKDLLKVAGDSQLAAAEPKTEGGKWDVEALRFAVQCYERVQQKEPGDLVIINALVWAQVKGFRAYDNANAMAAPLRQALRKGTLPFDMYETLAMVELSSSRYDEARRLLASVLEPRASVGQVVEPTASLYIHLALAHYHLVNYREAAKALAAAANLPQKPRVSQEFKQAQTLLNGTKP